MELLQTSDVADGHLKWYNHLGINLAVSYEVKHTYMYLFSIVITKPQI